MLLLDKVLQNTVIFQWHAEQLFVKAKDRQMICETQTNHNVLRQPSFNLLFYHSITKFAFKLKPAQWSCLEFFTQEHGYNIYGWVEYYLQQNTC